MNKYARIGPDFDRLRLTELWKSKEAEIKADTAEEHDLEWGRLREEFYGDVGHIPLPPIDIARLASMKDKYKGERIFIIGNGPSINRTPLHLLKNEYTFGVNRIYLLYDRIKWKPSFYTALDWRVVPDVAREINALTGSTFFFEERFRGLLREGDDVYYYTHGPAPSDRPEDKAFSHDMSHGVRGAGSVIGTAVQIAFHLGFDPIYLIGCDLGYKVPESVQQDGEDRFGNGVKLHLTSTEDDDANHFDPRYFGKGRRWHDPNVKRMVQGHEQCRQGIESVGRRIYNATLGGELEVYERRNFVDLFPEEIALNSTREDARSVDETEVVSHLLQNRTGRKHVMLDVGAHRGSSAQYFDKLGWSIHCFEPDKTNRGFLTKRFGNSKNIVIDPRAVSDQAADGVQFFTSPESSGISGLLPFRETHVESDLVKVTTVADIAKSRDLGEVDFLKIDVEGYDLNVLKGVPWDTLKPEVVECEFEDAKTLKLGHSWKDVAEFLRQKGYTVYLSEWHPIRRYGTAHDWRRVVPYPGVEMPEKSWGNILAFQNDPGFEVLSDAFKACLKQRQNAKAEPNASQATAKPEAAQPEPAKTQPAVSPGPAPTPQHKPLVHGGPASRTPPPLSMVSAPPVEPKTRVESIKHFLSASFTHIWARRAWSVPAMVIVLGLFLVSYLAMPAILAVTIRVGLLVLLLGGAIAYVAFRAFTNVTRLHQEIEALRLQSRNDRLALAAMRNPFTSVKAEDLNKFIASKIDPRIRNLTRPTASALDGQVSKLKSAEAKIQNVADEIKKLQATIKQLPELTGALEGLDGKIVSQSNRFESVFGHISTAIGQTTTEIDRMRQNISEMSAELNQALQDISVKSETEAAKVQKDLEGEIDRMRQNISDVSIELSQALEDASAKSETETAKVQEASSQRADDLEASMLSEIETARKIAADRADALETGLGKTSDRLEPIETQISALKNDLQNAQDEFKIQYEKVFAKAEHGVADLDREMLKLREHLTSKISEFSGNQKTLENQLEQQSANWANVDKWSVFDNRNWYQHFNRRLKKEHIDTIEQSWKKTLGLPVTRHSLGYIANRAALIEQTMDGRLATSIEDILLRTLIARSVKSKTIDVLEIGTLFGTGVGVMYDHLYKFFDKVHFTLLDPLDGYYHSGQNDGPTGVPITETQLRRNLHRVGMQDAEFTLIKHLSTEPEAIEAAEKHSYDLLVIDGDHSYAGVKADFENYVEFVKLGGYIIFDDYAAPDWPEVQKYVDDEVEHYDYVARVGHSWRTCVFRVVKAPPKQRTPRRRSPAKSKSTQASKPTSDA